ncbi:hypothetical protein SAMN05660226_03174 [Parapedobacter luteus]|uniref:Ig-like domain-containing protein n=2 Tax=Parapedobacter luteus TaxID=623280 RepID=A0A1T5E5N7_9SPHI|nr:hypothetical protein SAMN05660226_03174 [Parapedobacter luteus]
MPGFHQDNRMFRLKTCTFTSPRLPSCIAFILLFGAVKAGYGQRVYADAQQSSPTQSLIVTLSQVSNPARAVDSDTSNFSTLSVTLGALGAITANQNLQYVARPKPTPATPIIIKFGSTASLLNLLGGFAVQRTNGGRNSVVQPSYSGAQLLNLLNLFGGSQVGTAIIPPNNMAFDGVRLEINTTLGGLLQAFYYFAFYITPPRPSVSELRICTGDSATLAISNFQPGYTYRLYTSQTGSGEVPGATTTTNLLTLSSNIGTGNYWLEARESDLYPSARVQLAVTVVPRPAAPNISLNPDAQY